jgi:T5SS/PEP-CTERM-associated repeat protein
LIGHSGTLSPGDLRVGDTNVALNSLNGDIVAGDWGLGVSPGSIAQVTITGGRAFVTQSSGTSTLTIGDAGTASLRIATGHVQAATIKLGRIPGASGSLIAHGSRAEVRVHHLWTGSGGSEGVGNVIVTNGAVLEANVIDVSAALPLHISGVLQFSTNLPSIPDGVVTLSSGVLSFRDVSSTDIRLVGGPLEAITRLGNTRLRLINATNATVPGLVLQAGDSESYSELLLQDGTNQLSVDGLKIATSGRIIASNTLSRITGTVTNSGRIELVNSTLIFDGPVYFEGGSTLTGANSRVVFNGVVNLPAEDIQVGAGLRLTLSTITTEGGRLLLDGTELEAGESFFPSGNVVLTDGVVTYIDTADAPLAFPPGVEIRGQVGLRFVNSSNVFVENYNFETGGGYSELLLTGGTDLWQSGRLRIGAGGSVLVSNVNAAIKLTQGEFRIDSGGRFQDLISLSNYIGFAAEASNFVATLTDTGSVWRTGGPLSIGYLGSGNRLVIADGAEMFSSSCSIGSWPAPFVLPGSAFNSATLVGPGTVWRNTSTFEIGPGSSNVLEIAEGAALFTKSARMRGGGSNNTVRIHGTNSQLIVSNQLDAGGLKTFFEVSEGAHLKADALLFFGSGSMLQVEGPGTLLEATSGIGVLGSGLTLFGENLFLVRAGASLVSSNLYLNSSGPSTFEVTSPGTKVWIKDVLGVAAPFFRSIDTNQVIVRDGAELVASGISMISGSGVAKIINSGLIRVTNQTGIGTVSINGGQIEQRAGLLLADQIIATNGMGLRLRAGTVETRRSEFGGTNAMTVGEGTAHAALLLLGETNVFRKGLEIRRLAEFGGSGTAIGRITNYGSLLIPAPGKILQLADTLDLKDCSKVVFRIQGANVGEAGVLQVLGPVKLAGSLMIQISLESTPGSTDAYVLFQAETFEGAFSNVVAGRVLIQDRLGSFRLESTASALILTDFQSDDADADGIQDNWALQYFGISPLPVGNTFNSRNGDADGDNLLNYEEFRLDTDPLDAKSGLKLEVRLHPTGFPVLRFPLLPDRTVRIHHSTNLIEWSSAIPSTLEATAVSMREWVDKDATAGSQHFYFISAE